jgi:citrate lyase subunit beta / citryl-CoA lyase
MSARSYLFVPANRSELIKKALSSAADCVIIDLEDAVPADQKDLARLAASRAISDLEESDLARVWVRTNAVGSRECQSDLSMLVGSGVGIRLPKVDSPADLEWVATRLNGASLIATIESAQAVAAAESLARFPGMTRLALGGLDLIHDLQCSDDPLALLFARSAVVVASRAAGLPGPINSVYPILDDEEGLRRHVQHAASLGFGGQSVLSPRQLRVVHEVYSADPNELAWAQDVLKAFQDAGGQATRSSAGEFVDLPVARRAAKIAARHGGPQPSQRG